MRGAILRKPSSDALSVAVVLFLETKRGFFFKVSYLWRF